MSSNTSSAAPSLSAQISGTGSRDRLPGHGHVCLQAWGQQEAGGFGRDLAVAFGAVGAVAGFGAHAVAEIGMGQVKAAFGGR